MDISGLSAASLIQLEFPARLQSPPIAGDFRLSEAARRLLYFYPAFAMSFTYPVISQNNKKPPDF
jgi:hypothetical protein